MSDMSQSENWQSTPPDFADHGRSFLLRAPAVAGGRSVASHSAPDDSSATDTVAGLIHDTRNMVMALDLYCDLLGEPGVLSAPFGHYAGELRLVSGASRRLMEKLAKLSAVEMLPSSLATSSGQEISALNLLNFPDSVKEPETQSSFSAARMRAKSGGEAETETAFGTTHEGSPSDRPFNSSLPMRQGKTFYSEPQIDQNGASSDLARGRWRSAGPSPVEPMEQTATDGTALWPRSRAKSRKPLELYMDRRIEDLAAELRANHHLLCALAGPGMTVKLSVSGGHIPIVMAPEDLTRVLVNLVRNAVEAMRGGGELQISLEEGPQFVALSFADNGPGIPREVLDKVFSPGYSSHSATHRDERPAQLGESDREARMSVGSSELSIADSNAPSAVQANSASGLNAKAWPIQHRGLGLSIVRAIVTAAGGSVWASNRAGDADGGSLGGLATAQEATSGGDREVAAGEQMEVAPGNARAALPGAAPREKGSGGAIIHIEFPSPPSSS